MADLSQLTAEVTNIGDVSESVKTLVEHLADLIESTPTDQASIDALVSQLRTSKQTLADAVVRGTEVEGNGNPPPPPPPPPDGNPDEPGPTPEPSPSPEPTPESAGG